MAFCSAMKEALQPELNYTISISSPVNLGSTAPAAKELDKQAAELGFSGETCPIWEKKSSVLH